jgi:hypothetical protein
MARPGSNFVMIFSAAAACASEPRVDVQIVGRVQGVERVPAEKLQVFLRGATAPPGGAQRIAWLRVRWEEPEDRDAARRAMFEEASLFGADAILDYEERVDDAERRTYPTSSWRGGEMVGNDLKGLAYLGAFLTLATIASFAQQAPEPERGTISGCAARTGTPTPSDVR